jgi:peptidoglycan/LPS O-acetylase OafA/YrhL
MLAVVMTRQPGLGRFLSRLLSAKPLAWLADLSYDIYLIHSFVRFMHPCSVKCRVHQ